MAAHGARRRGLATAVRAAGQRVHFIASRHSPNTKSYNYVFVTMTINYIEKLNFFFFFLRTRGSSVASFYVLQNYC